jgi:hypothetical protein
VIVLTDRARRFVPMPRRAADQPAWQEDASPVQEPAWLHRGVWLSAAATVAGLSLTFVINRASAPTIEHSHPFVAECDCRFEHPSGGSFATTVTYAYSNTLKTAS